MSHFNVAVFSEQGQDIDALLEPFSVEHDVEPYVWMAKGDIIKK